jgi:hypothetical protein
LETSLRVGTTDNDINALKNNGSIPEGYTFNHYLNPTKLRFPFSDVNDVAYATKKVNPLWDTINYNTNTLTELNTKSIPVSVDYQAPG